MNPQQREQLIVALKEIAQEMNRELDLVLVEGKRDKSALRQLGFTGNLVKASRFKPSRLQGRETVAILTDFDREGRKLRKRLLQRFNSKAEIDKGFRKRLGKWLGHYGRRDIEAINNLLQDL